MEVEEEIYKEHKSGYLISNMGNIKGKLVENLKLTITLSGYVMFSKGSVHRAVVETFIGEIPKGYEIDHLNGIRHDNRLSNLEIVTKSENIKRVFQRKPNIKMNGIKHPNSTLTEENIIDIYTMIKNQSTNDDIALKYNLHSRYVSLIRHGKRWKHLWDLHFKNGEQLISLGNYIMDLDTQFKILDLITDTTLNNTEIAKIYSIDISNISRIRSKNAWKDIWRLYYKNKNIDFKIDCTATRIKNNK